MTFADIDNSIQNSRLNPALSQKIRSMVAGGETRLYVIRKSLRFVLMDLEMILYVNNVHYFDRMYWQYSFIF